MSGRMLGTTVTPLPCETHWARLADLPGRAGGCSPGTALGPPVQLRLEPARDGLVVAVLLFFLVLLVLVLRFFLLLIVAVRQAPPLLRACNFQLDRPAATAARRSYLRPHLTAQSSSFPHLHTLRFIILRIAAHLFLPSLQAGAPSPTRPACRHAA